MTCKDRLEAYLRDRQVPFETQQHRRAFTAQGVAASEHISGKLVAKVVIVFADSRMVMLALPASHRVDLTKVGAALGAKQVYLAGEREIALAFPDCDIGAMPPFGTLYNIPVYVDRLLAEDETIVFQAGTHCDTISMSYADFARLVEPTVAQFARHALDLEPYVW